ncbi:MAG: oxidoreductase [Rhodospirillaceae bacterium]|nr:oxidoreductase [Rhodospirillaceae bacterium]|tara:strand:- start:48608 stop:49327 length:720 start_codon:yes stop_codon:yes gene_type:complete
MTGTEQRLSGRVALITGASRGIGAAVAKRYAAEGAKVILTARTVAGLEEVDDDIRAELGQDAQATLVPLDLENFEEIDKLTPAIAGRFGKLDILVGNAGLLGEMTPLVQIEPESWQQIIDINLTANWRLIRALQPLLLASKAGRAMFLTTGVAGGRAYWGGYAISKTALEAMVITWAQEMAETALKVNLINPGAVRTSMRASAYPGEDPMSLPAPEEITDIFVDLADVNCKHSAQLLTP